MTKSRNHHPNPSDERDDIMTDRTRFPDGAKRAKKVYEDIDVVFAGVVAGTLSGDCADEERTIEEFCELLKALTGITSNGSYDPDVAEVGREAARRWLRATGYVS
jgi:hypothetical protein